MPILGLLVLTTFAPGWLILMAGGARYRLAAIACAPAMTFLLMGVGGLLFRLLGVRWHAPTVIACTIVCALAVAATRWGWLRLRGEAPGLRTWLAPAPEAAPGATSSSGAPGEPPMADARATLGSPALVWGAIAAAWVIMTLPVLPGTGPGIPIQSADSIYHYNQAWLIEHTGNASMLDGNAGMFGLDGKYSFYPMVWHEIITIVAVGWTQVVPVTNAMLLVVPLVWLVGMVYLARVILPEIRGSVLLTLGAAGLTPIFPMRLLMDTAVWPYCLALAASPAVVAWMVAAWRRCMWLWAMGRRRRTPLVLLAPMAGLLGVILAHPSASVIIGWPLAVVAWTGILLAGARHLRSGEARRRRRGMLLLGLAAMVVVAGIIFVLAPGPQQEHFSRSPDRNWDNPIIKLAIPVLLFYGGGGWMTKTVYITLALLCFLGVAVSYARHRHRGVAVAWVACLPLTLAATAPVPILSSLTGTFYNNPHRLKAMTAVPAILLAVIAMAALGPWLEEAWRWWRGRAAAAGAPTASREGPGQAAGAPGPTAPVRSPGGPMRRWAPAVAALLVLVAGTVGSLPALRLDVAGAFAPRLGHTRMVVSSAELAMIERLSSELPPDALVVGDPVAGTAMLPFTSGRRSVWMFAGQADSDADGLYLRYHFRDIHRDPRVCEIVRKHGITHFYRDVSQPFNGVPTPILRPGLYGVGVAQGFTLVDRGGQAAVYRIDMCHMG
nr:DUF6541 family protein [Actinomyces bowdenii]